MAVENVALIIKVVVLLSSGEIVTVVVENVALIIKIVAMVTLELGTILLRSVLRILLSYTIGITIIKVILIKYNITHLY